MKRAMVPEVLTKRLTVVLAIRIVGSKEARENFAIAILLLLPNETWLQRPDISFILRILYPIHIQEKRIWIYILYPLSKFLPALSQFLNNKKPDLVALQHTSPRLLTGSN
jgi:hypothetical protein